MDKYIYFVKCKIRKTNRLFKESELEFRKKMDRKKKDVLKFVGLEFQKLIRNERYINMNNKMNIQCRKIYTKK